MGKKGTYTTCAHGENYPLGLSRLSWAIRTEVLIVLREQRGRKTTSARKLGISRDRLYALIRSLAIMQNEWRLESIIEDELRPHPPASVLTYVHL